MFELGEMDKPEDINLETFKVKIRKYCRLAGKTQQALANQLAYPCSFLSAKLNGSSNSILTIPDVKEIIRILAQWQAINLKSEAIELLQLRNLSFNAFTNEEWSTPPLSRLEAGEIYNRLFSINLDSVPAIANLINNLINDSQPMSLIEVKSLKS